MREAGERGARQAALSRAKTPRGLLMEWVNIALEDWDKMRARMKLTVSAGMSASLIRELVAA